MDYIEKLFDNGSITMIFHILNVPEGLGGHAKDMRCAESRNPGKSTDIEEKHILEFIIEMRVSWRHFSKSTVIPNTHF